MPVSTSNEVVTHAPCSVMVVRATNMREQFDRSLQVTVAFDGSAASRRHSQQCGCGCCFGVNAFGEAKGSI
ncbi:MAG: hypothetical protein VYA84_02430 [Planctomycetota bacterium]|nr:hypothetical protein [Planctomycetota bacterium]